MTEAPDASAELLPRRDLDQLCARQSLQRLRLVLPAVVPIVVAHFLYFGLTAVPGLPPSRLLWRQLLAGAQLGILAALLPLTALCRRAWQKPDEPLRFRAWLPACFAALFLCGTAAMAAVDQLVTTAITPYITACMGVALALRLTTRATIFVYVAGLLVLVACVPILQPLPDARVNALVNGLTVTGVSLAISLAFTRTLGQAERARRTIDHQRSELTTLRGLMRVCSYCKRIHNERKQWEPLDSYVARSSGSQITHGMCEACFESQPWG